MEIIEEKIKNHPGFRGKIFSQQTAADFLGVTKGKFRSWQKGQRPNAGDLSILGKALNLSPNWLLYGEGDPEDSQKFYVRRIAPHAQPVPINPTVLDESSGYIVDIYSTTGAGPASERWEPEPIARVCLPPAFYRPGQLVLQVEGSSMEPTIKNGAWIGVNTDKRNIISGEIYAMRIPYEGLVIKRVSFDIPNERLILKSERRDVPDAYLPLSGYEEQVVGKVVWVTQWLG